MAELLLEDLAFGDVAGVDHHAPHGRVIEQVVDDMLEVTPGAVLVGHSGLQWRVKPGFFQDLGECVQRLLPVVRVNGAECAGPYLLLGLVAHHPLDCRAYVADGAVGLEECDDIGAVPYQGAEALLALLDDFLDLLALSDVTDDGRKQPFTILEDFTEGHFDRKLATVFAKPHQLGRAAYHARFARSYVAVQSGHAEIPVSF